MERKFNIGDRVRLNGRNPNWLYDKDIIVRKRTRIITRIVYSNRLQANLYFLGSNNRGGSDCLLCTPFRSYQLKPVANNKRGRPKTKRKYNRKHTQLHSIIPANHCDSDFRGVDVVQGTGLFKTT